MEKVRTENITFLSDGQKISGQLFVPVNESPKGGVIIIHGSSNEGRAYGAKKNYAERAKTIAATGFAVLTFDLRGYGESEGDLEQLSVNDHVNDAVNAFDYMKEKYSTVHIYATSYGGYLAVLSTENLVPETLVLQSPAIYPDNLPKAKRGNYTNKTRDFRENGNLSDTLAMKVINEYKNPLYIIVSENDESVPERVARAYYESAGSSVKSIDVVSGATHRIVDPVQKRELLGYIQKWFNGERQAK